MYGYDRNSLFEVKEHLIGEVIGSNYTMLRACKMDRQDVYQELAIRLLEAIEKYDERICDNLDAYLTVSLKNRLFNLTSCSKRFGMPYAPKRGFSVLSLQDLDQYGNEREIPSVEDFSDTVWIKREISALPSNQRHALRRLLSGKRVTSNNKALTAARRRFRILTDGQIACAV